MIKKIVLATAAMLMTLMPLTAAQAQAATGTNLITNPGVETNTTGWTNNGDTGATYTVANEGYNSSKSLKVEFTNYTTGTADWYHEPIAVTAGTSYTYSQWYKSNAATTLDIEMYNSTGTVVAGSNVSIATAIASPSAWNQVSASFTVPASVTSMVFYQVLSSTGYLQVDNAELVAGSTTPTDPGTGNSFAKPMISVTFDDGWTNQYTNARSILNANGIKSTFYLISNEITRADHDSTYMTANQAKTLLADGHELASHTVHHCSMTNSTSDDGLEGCTGNTNVKLEMEQSKADLATATGAPITNFAYPFGEYNDASIAAGVAAGYTSQRTVTQGLNTKANLNLNKLYGYEVDANTQVATVKAWIDNAIAQNAWIVLFYHEVANTPAYPDDAQYTVNIANFTEVMQYIKSKQSSIDIKTVAQAISTINGGGTTNPPVNPPATTGTPVYRMANWITKERLFTVNLNEVNTIKDKNGWVYEGVAFQASSTAGTPVYRMANWITKERLFTVNLNEVNTIKDKNGWVYEGVAFQAVQ